MSQLEPEFWAKKIDDLHYTLSIIQLYMNEFSADGDPAFVKGLYGAIVRGLEDMGRYEDSEPLFEATLGGEGQPYDVKFVVQYHLVPRDDYED